MSASARSSSAKRSATDNLSNSSEDELDEVPDLDTTRLSAGSSRADSGIDCGSSHDYSDAPPCSPGGSSTSSGPVYTRPAGFRYHAQQIQRPKIKKKKKYITLLASDDSRIITVKPDAGTFRQHAPVPPKPKLKRDPLPMRMRAFPQSFWQQPNNPVAVSPAHIHKVLPPLSLKDELDTLRPVTPPGEKDSNNNRVAPQKRSVSSHESKIIVQNNADSLLGKLFDTVEDKFQPKKPDSIKSTTVTPNKRPGISRGKKVFSNNKSMLHGCDPYMVETITDKLFPHLTLERAGIKTQTATSSNNTSVQLITLREGDKTVTLPSLCIEQNYSQALSDLVPHL